MPSVGLNHLATSLAALGLAATASAQSRTSFEGINLAAERAAIESFQQYDQRLQDVGWRLLRSNADFCERVTPSIGLQLQDMASYGRPDVARAALGLQGDFAVQTAAAGSPAAVSGEFRPNREITGIGALLPNRFGAGERLDWRRLARTHDTIDEALEMEGHVHFTFVDGTNVELTPVPTCAGRFELASSSDAMVANSRRVLLGIESENFSFTEDVFAAGIAHETAHMVLDHTAWLDRNGRGNSKRRATEREADRLMPWLLANAGYDPRAAIRFFEQFRPTSGAVLFIRGSHEKWRDRAALVEAEIAQIEAVTQSEGKADWSAHFRREIDPRQGLDD